MDPKRSLALLSFLIPLLFIFLSAVWSPWFNILNNALSDLGHATKSSVAPLFNMGLMIGGFLISVLSIKYIWEERKDLALTLLSSGFSLILIAVFDEIYGILHFIVSLAFFLSLGAFLTMYAVRHRSVLPIIALIISVLSWFMHLAWQMPKGAAIPELISILLVLPFYMNTFFERPAQ